MTIILSNYLDLDILPMDEMTLGINYIKGDGYPVNELGETDFDAEPITVNKLTFGLLFIALNVCWND
jgi:hypothetical protein